MSIWICSYASFEPTVESWITALEQCLYVMSEIQACRDAGFTEEALKYPRSRKGLIALCAFNGIPVDKAPRGWHYWPGKGMKVMWERVIEALTKDAFNADE